MSDSTTIDKIRAGDEGELTRTYEAYRNEFISWACRSYGCSGEDAKEAYQVSFLIFYDNVLSGKLTQISSSLKTYIFAIGKNKIFEQHRYRSKNQHEVNEQVIRHDVFQMDEHGDEKEEKYKMVEQGLTQLGNPCKQILEMVYYEKRSMDYITQSLGYKNMSTTKNQKYKCLNRLRKLFFKKK